MRFQDVRLSKHFLLLDFLHDRDLYTKPIANLADTVTETALENGGLFCQNLVEPMIQKFGPCSVAAGYTPLGTGHYTDSPHCWEDRTGAGADIAFHDWVNLDRPPIKLLEEWLHDGKPFERIITYAGSEFMCLALKKGRSQRHAFYENVRRPGHDKPWFVSHSRHPGDFARHPKTFPARVDWRRAPNEPVYHTRRNIRPQHVRLGRYFTLLDFARCEEAMQEAKCWVPPITATKQGYYGRMFCEIIDPVVAKYGRVSVVSGMAPASIARQGLVDQKFRWVNGNARIRFVLPLGVRAEEVLTDPDLFKHPSIVELKAEDHPSGGELIDMEIEPFEPRTIYSGGFPYAYYAGEVPSYLPARIRKKLQNS